MCVGNRASSAAFYVNKQLQSLYEISQDCVKKHGYGIKASSVEVEYGSALAQICVGQQKTVNPSINDLTFFAAFSAAPEIKFICNHELAIFFKIKAGQYKIQGKSTPESFEEYTCAFRVPFHEHTIVDSGIAAVGLAHSKAKVIILDFNSAIFLRDFSKFATSHNLTVDKADNHHKYVIKFINQYYFPLLRKAGYHVIYSLPDFDNLSRTHLIDYSSMSDIEIETYEIFGITVDSINEFLRGRWLEATAHIDGTVDATLDYTNGGYALAEHKGQIDDLYFHIFFGPPQIRVRCGKEVIYYLNIQEIDFREGGWDAPTVHKVYNWKIALVVEAVLYHDEHTGMKSIRLDFSHARFSDYLSVFISQNIEETILIKIRTIFVQYIMQKYIVILEEYHQHGYEHHHHHHDIEIDSSEDHTEVIKTHFEEFREHLCITETYGWDMVTAISQGSINDYFYSLWKASLKVNGGLSSWSFEKHFDSAIGPIQIRFPSDAKSRKVILYVTLLEGRMTNMGLDKKIVEGDTHEFLNWRIAFEVNLTSRDSVKPHAVLDKRFTDEGSNWTFKQLVLDLRSAKVQYGHSTLPGLHESGDYLKSRCRGSALLHYISQKYFAFLEQEEYNVLFSVPMLKKGCASQIIKFAPTTLECQFVHSLNTSINFGNCNMLVVCGMMNDKPNGTFPLPSTSWRWVSSEDRFSGSFSLSNSAFLDGWFLRELETINERTTLVPVFHGIGDEGNWDINVVKWHNHPSIKLSTKPRVCRWNRLGETKDGIEYQWKYKDEWTYTHEGDVSHIYNGGYSVSCHTTNNLTLPTVNRHGVCEIKLKGRVELKLSFTGNGKVWSTGATAGWTATIRIANDSSGYGLTITSTSTRDLPRDTGFSGNRELVHAEFLDAAAHLRRELAEVVLVEESTLASLRSAFYGTWPLFYSGAYGYSLANASFNSTGDVLFEMVAPLSHEGVLRPSTEVTSAGTPEKIHAILPRPISGSQYTKDIKFGSGSSSVFGLGYITETIKDGFSTALQTVTTGVSNGSATANGHGPDTSVHIQEFNGEVIQSGNTHAGLSKKSSASIKRVESVSGVSYATAISEATVETVTKSSTASTKSTTATKSATAIVAQTAS